MFDFLDQYPYLLPVIIFFGRIIDVTLGTLRIIFVSKGEKYKAPIIGFFEVFIWIVIISQIFSRANDLLAYISYAASSLVRMIKNRGYGVTVMEGMGSIMKAWVVEAVVERKALKEIDQYITNFDKNTFYTAEDVRIRQKGIFPEPTSFFNRWRPGK